MARTDILIDPDSVDVVTAGGVLNVTRFPDDESSFEFHPDNAYLEIGQEKEGGQGEDGRVQLVTSNGKGRINLSSFAPLRGKPGNVIRIEAHGNPDESAPRRGPPTPHGIIELGRIIGSGTKKTRESTVKLNGEEALISLGDNSSEHVTLNGRNATVTVGDSSGEGSKGAESKFAGSIELMNVENTKTVSVEGGSGQEHNERTGGSIQLRDAEASNKAHLQANGGRGGGMLTLENASRRTVVVDGGTGTMVLGNGTSSRLGRGVQPENGELWLDDGQGKKFGLKAENGTIGLGPSSDSSGIGLVLKPDQGIFSIVDSNGNPIFRVNTRQKTVKVNQSYSFSP